MNERFLMWPAGLNFEAFLKEAFENHPIATITFSLFMLAMIALNVYGILYAIFSKEKVEKESCKP